MEVRAFCPGDGISEDPATGSLNAVAAQWLLESGRLAPSFEAIASSELVDKIEKAGGRLDGGYLAAQGGCIGRACRIHVGAVLTMEKGKTKAEIWIGGRCVSCIQGTVSL